MMFPICHRYNCTCKNTRSEDRYFLTWSTQKFSEEAFNDTEKICKSIHPSSEVNPWVKIPRRFSAGRIQGSVRVHRCRLFSSIEHVVVDKMFSTFVESIYFCVSRYGELAPAKRILFD